MTTYEIDGPEVELLCPNCYYEWCKIVGWHPSDEFYVLACPICDAQFYVSEDVL
jgi:hypothetical protein